ncbi:MAG: PmoA family protein, partial [Thermoguttaceae bacterium]|nr:PmoA family protein [Thermoguttaceae bacterium]
YYFGLGMRFARDMNESVRFSNSTGAHDGAIVRGDERLKDCNWIKAAGTIGGKNVSVTIEEKEGNTRPMTGYSMGDGWKAFAYMGGTMRVHEDPILLEPGQTITAEYKVVLKDEP